MITSLFLKRRRYERRLHGFTLPELIAVSVLLAIGVAAVATIPRIGRGRANDTEAHATASGVLQAASAVWTAQGEIPEGEAAVKSALQDIFSRVEYLDVVNNENPPGTIPSVRTNQIGDTVAVAYIPGASGAVGVAARSASGRCFVTRLDFGEGSRPQRFGVIPADAPERTDGAPEGVVRWDPQCSGVVALRVIEADEDFSCESRDGGTWGTAIQLAPTAADAAAYESAGGGNFCLIVNT